MSLYNMAMGTNPFAGTLLQLLGFKDPDTEIPRLRDCYVDTQGYVVILTRTGGPNRSSYQEQNEQLAARPGFVGTCDWDVDNTFALWVYNTTDNEPVDNIVQQLAELGARMDLTAKWNAMLQDMDSPQPKPSVQAMLQRMEPLLAQLRQAVEGQGGSVVLVDADKSGLKADPDK